MQKLKLAASLLASSLALDQFEKVDLRGNYDTGDSYRKHGDCLGLSTEVFGRSGPYVVSDMQSAQQTIDQIRVFRDNKNLPEREAAVLSEDFAM
jgi:hypothetical protein